MVSTRKAPESHFERMRAPHTFSAPGTGPANARLAFPAPATDVFDPYDEGSIAPLIAPSPRKESYRNSFDDARPMSAAGTLHPRAHRGYNVGILLTAVVASLITAGMASSLLGWLLSRRVYGADSGAFHHALVAAETRPKIFAKLFGEHTNAGSDDAETTMYGLALSSVVVHLVPLTIPLVLSVFAYVLASMWLQAQARGQLGNLPTPAQYGHLVALCGAFGFFSLYDTAKYLSPWRRKKPAASNTLVAAFIAALGLLIITYVLSLSDIWLHTTAKTFSLNIPTPILPTLLPALGSQINNTMCPAPSLFLRNGVTYSNCQHVHDPDLIDMSWGDAGLINEGAAVLGNTSVSSEIRIIDNAATLLPKTLPTGVQDLVFTTFAIEATCSLVDDCQIDVPLPGTNDTYFLVCPRFTPTFAFQSEAIAANDRNAMPMLNQFNVTDNTLIFESGTPDYPAVSVGSVGQYESSGYALDSVLNPAGALVVLYWDGAPFDVPEDDKGWYGASDAPVLYLFHLSSCVLDVWDVTLSYSAPSNGSTPSFTTISKARSDFDTTSALLAALDTVYSATLASHLTTTLQPSAEAPSDIFTTLLAGNLSQGVLAYAAPLTERVISLSGEAVNSTRVSRYPLAPLSLVLSLTYGYSLLALGLGIVAFKLSSRAIATEGPDAELDMLHLRLTSPRVCVTDRFAELESEPLMSGEDSIKQTSRVKRLGAGFAQRSGRAQDSQITLRDSRRFTVHLLEDSEDNTGSKYDGEDF